MRVYLSGPITGTEDYLEKFQAEEERLKKMGFEVINPAKVCAELPELEHDEYMSICLPMLRLCRFIHLLSGWEESEGAREELAEALRLKMLISLEDKEEEE